MTGDGQQLRLGAGDEGCPHRDEECSGFRMCPEPVRCAIDYLHDLTGADPGRGVIALATRPYRVMRVSEFPTNLPTDLPAQPWITHRLSRICGI